ncbi:eCIS core domain-containing protein [Thalassiella azotivora]
MTSAPDAVGDRRVLGEGAVTAPDRAGDPYRPAAPVAAPEASAVRSPEQRWQAATRLRPLETAQPLPAAFHPLASAVVGGAPSSVPVRYTTGPATRAALAAAGARAATSRGLLHLPRPPAPGDAESVGLVAHELAHLRSAVVRPRFLLRDHDHAADEDERGARHVGELATGLAAPGVRDLPVAGAARNVAEVARRAATAAVLSAAPVAAALGRDGGGGGLRGGLASAADLWDGASSAGAGAADDVPGPAGGASTHAPGPSVSPGGAAGGARAASGGAATAGAPGGAAAPNAAPGTGVLPDMDRVVEALEERLLAEIERRGGRWQGVF